MTVSANPEVVVREARPADADAVVAFTRDTWGDRHEDYIPRAFPAWAASDDPDRGTFVATVASDTLDVEGVDDRTDGDTLVEGDGYGVAPAGEPEAVVGCIQAVLLSEWEAWAQGIRVDPAARGLGVGTTLSTTALDWARDRGASVCRNMVFSWNVAGFGQSRAVGFEPTTSFRFAEPEPAESPSDPSTGSTTDRPAEATDRPTEATDRPTEAIDDPDPNAAWAFWTDGDARDHLRGLALDDDESWACSELTRERLREAAADGRLLAVRGSPPGVNDGDAFAGFAVRAHVSEPPGDGSDRVAVYGIAAWRDADAAGRLYESIAADAAGVDANAARVVIPETVEHVSDTALNRVPVSGEPDFVLSADLTDDGVGTGDSAERP